MTEPARPLAATPDSFEGDVNGTPRRREWIGRLSPETRRWLAEDERYFLRQSLSTPCLNVMARCEGGSGGMALFGRVAAGSCESPLKLATATTIPEPTTSTPSTAHVMITTGLVASCRGLGGGGAEVTG